ncbi:MAG TPA: hypothetical protein VFV98_17530 [Vicinamibacterales bacterium]|nr:hypothetical protein [Vicinamibacterales bacterium]
MHFTAGLATLLLTAVLTAQAKPEFSGTWVLDVAKTTQLNGGRSGGMAPAGSMGGGAMSNGSTGGGNVLTPAGAPAPPMELKIAQTAAALTIERQTPMGPQKFVHKLDGSESVNVNGRATLKTKSQWQGAALVTEGTNVINGEDGAMTVTIKETRSLEADGSLLVVTARIIDGTTTTSRQVFAKKKL